MVLSCTCFTMNFYIYIFQLTLCIWRGTIITLLQFIFLDRFLQDSNKVFDYY